MSDTLVLIIKTLLAVYLFIGFVLFVCVCVMDSVIKERAPVIDIIIYIVLSIFWLPVFIVLIRREHRMAKNKFSDKYDDDESEGESQAYDSYGV